MLNEHASTEISIHPSCILFSVLTLDDKENQPMTGINWSISAVVGLLFFFSRDQVSNSVINHRWQLCLYRNNHYSPWVALMKNTPTRNMVTLPFYSLSTGLKGMKRWHHYYSYSFNKLFQLIKTLHHRRWRWNDINRLDWFWMF